MRHNLPPSPFITDLAAHRARIDQQLLAAVEAAIAESAAEADEPAPVFLRSPRPEYLSATQLRPIVDILGRHAAPR